MRKSGLIQIISYLNPLTYGVDALRQVLAGVAHFGLVTRHFGFKYSWNYFVINWKLPFF